MNETYEIYENQEVQEAPAKPSKTWTYSEHTNKVTTHHTLTVDGKKLTHIEESKHVGRTTKMRTDIKLDNVISVSTYYGTKKNILGVILAVCFALVTLAVAIMGLATETTAIALVGFVLTALAGFVAWAIFKNVRPSFALIIETIYPRGIVKNNAFAYGSQNFAFGQASSRSPLAALVASFRKLFGLGMKYRFEMDAATGEDIMNTMGDYLLND